MAYFISGYVARILRKSWSGEKIQKYIGSYKDSFFAYAQDESIRKRAASGGVITALLAHLLENGAISGALVCRTVVRNGKVRPEFYIAQDVTALLDSQGSKYCEVHFAADALPLIKNYQGSLCVIALPCDVTLLRRSCEKDRELADKVTLIISLFCGHNSRPELTDMVIRNLIPSGEELKDFRYRVGHWRGSLQLEFVNGLIVKRSFSCFSDYQNLYFFCQQKCHHCHDHTGYQSDISIGDIWSMRMKENPIKHNAVILRTEKGAEVFQSACNVGRITVFPEPIEDICAGQARTMPFHYNVSSRVKAGKLLGISIEDQVHEQVRWNDFIVATIALFNEKLSRTKLGQNLIHFTPRIFPKIILYFMKALESL